MYAEKISFETEGKIKTFSDRKTEKVWHKKNHTKENTKRYSSGKRMISGRIERQEGIKNNKTVNT